MSMRGFTGARAARDMAGMSHTAGGGEGETGVWRTNDKAATQRGEG